jgi:hypothetical protein
MIPATLARYLSKLGPKALKMVQSYGAPLAAMGTQMATKGYETVMKDPLTAAALLGGGGILGYELGGLEDAVNPGKKAVTRDDMRQLLMILQGKKGDPFKRSPGRPKFPRDENGDIIRE